MAINKVDFGNTTLIDISNDTVTSNTLLQGATAHDNSGTQINGAVAFVTYYTGSSAPSANLGNNGDIYLQTA